LWSLQSMQWLLQQKNGASIRTPQFPLCKKTFVPHPVRENAKRIGKDLVYELLEDHTGMSRQELERLFEQALKRGDAPKSK
jgi:hypothetical protein